MKKRPLHILVLSPGFPSDENDTSCITALQDYLRQLTPSSEVQLSVIALHYPYKKRTYYWNNIPVYPMNGRNRANLAGLKTWKKCIQQFKKINKESPIDLIHCFWYNEVSFLGSWLGKLFHIPVVSTMMGQEIKNKNPFLSFMSDSNHFRVAVSDHQAKIAREKNTDLRIDGIIPWGIKPEDYGLSNRTIDLLAVGNLTTLKNFRLFIGAVREAVRIKPGLKAVVLGEGPELINLKIIAREKGIDKVIEWRGHLSRESVKDLMAQSKILVHPSSYESFGMIFIEALASGMSIVSFQTGIAQENEKWKIAANEQDFLQKVLRLLKEGTTYRGIYPYLINKTVEDYKALYKKATFENSKILNSGFLSKWWFKSSFTWLNL